MATDQMAPEDVPGRLSNEAGAVLRELARGVPRGMVIVEIGAFKGKSTCFLGVGSREGNSAPVVSIDPWDLPRADSGPTGMPALYAAPENQADHAKHVQACGVAHLVTQVKGYSHKVALPTQPVGLLWVDGAHDFASVSADIRRFCPLVTPGGVAVFDDYRLHCRGVDRAVNRLIRDKTTWRTWTTRAGRLAIGRKR